MTPKQIERIQNKIKRIRKEIYEEKKRWGGYHDRRGLRYIPFELYLKIQDFKGGLTYLRWFDKNFPDDNQMPEIMLMASLICFKNNKIKEAEKKLMLAYFADKLIIKILLETPYEKNDIPYSVSYLEEIKVFISDLKTQNDLTDFQDWVTQFQSSKTFTKNPTR